MKVLVINCGSSSLKYQIIDMTDESVIAKGKCDKINLDGSFIQYKCPAKDVSFEKEVPMKNHSEAIQILIDELTNAEYGAIKDVSEISEPKKLNEHPNIAYINALNEFKLNEKEENAIKSHMFPLGKELPKYKESWVLTGVDKGVATYEMTKFKLTTALTIYTLFITNMLLFGQK